MLKNKERMHIYKSHGFDNYSLLSKKDTKKIEKKFTISHNKHLLAKSRLKKFNAQQQKYIKDNKYMVERVKNAKQYVINKFIDAIVNAM